MNNNFDLKIIQAETQDLPSIWEIILFAKESRRLDGSLQWQDGYPNEQTLRNDIEKNYGFVLKAKEEIWAYVALIFEKEPAYEAIEGNWLNQDEYAVVHRLAVSSKAKGKGVAQWILREIEKICIQKEVFNIKIDTNFDNLPMLKIVENLGYVYCGEVYFRGAARKAFQKELKLSH